MSGRIAKCGPQNNTGRVRLIAGTTILDLPSPDFDNHEKLNFTRVNRRTRGGDLTIFRADYWSKSTTFSMQWSDLKHDTRESLIHLLRDNLGKVIVLLDQEDRAYNVIVTTPEGEFTENNRQRHTVTLDFETE